MYKVVGTVTSRAFRVLWMLEELGAPYELIEAEARSATIAAVNPAGKIPALIEGDHVLTDSTAIITYLGDKHGALTHPAGTIERAQQDALLNTVLDEIDAALWTVSRFSRVLPEEFRNDAMLPGLAWEFERNLGRLSDRLQGPCLQGETFTIADIVLVHCLGWAISVGFPKPDNKLRSYARDMRERPAFARARAAKAG
ncbi:MAG: glutathione S-transferase family protein [Arenibacterium sp.]